jgi:prepilin-type N-terminal cleavage/methylation domain-containing protein
MIRKLDRRGVTLIELLIATVIFSVILVIIMYAFLFVSNDYMRGTVESQTQETARSIVEQISQDIELDNQSVFPTANSTNGICVGNHRYSFQYNKELGTGSGDVSHALVVDTVSSCATQDAQDLSGAHVTGNELLGNHMRLGNFSIKQDTSNPNVSGQYTISITIGYGDDASQSGPLTVHGTAAPYSYVCPDLSLGGDFCATTTLTTIAQERVTNGSELDGDAL